MLQRPRACPCPQPSCSTWWFSQILAGLFLTFLSGPLFTCGLLVKMFLNLIASTSFPGKISLRFWSLMTWLLFAQGCCSWSLSIYTLFLFSWSLGGRGAKSVDSKAHLGKDTLAESSPHCAGPRGRRLGLRFSQFWLHQKPHSLLREACPLLPYLLTKLMAPEKTLSVSLVAPMLSLLGQSDLFWLRPRFDFQLELLLAFSSREASQNKSELEFGSPDLCP